MADLTIQIECSTPYPKHGSMLPLIILISRNLSLNFTCLKIRWVYFHYFKNISWYQWNGFHHSVEITEFYCHHFSKKIRESNFLLKSFTLNDLTKKICFAVNSWFSTLCSRNIFPYWDFTEFSWSWFTILFCKTVGLTEIL